MDDGPDYRQQEELEQQEYEELHGCAAARDSGITRKETKWASSQKTVAAETSSESPQECTSADAIR
jgi:hypothetical protein